MLFGVSFGGGVHDHDTEQFLGQGSNPGHSSDNTKSLTDTPPRNSKNINIVLFCFFIGPSPRHMKVPKLGVPSYSCQPMPQAEQCQILANSATYTTAHGNSGCFNPLIEAKDQTQILMDTSQIRFHCATAGTPHPNLY